MQKVAFNYIMNHKHILKNFYCIFNCFFFRKKRARIGEVSSTPVSLFIRSDDGSSKFFSESSKF